MRHFRRVYPDSYLSSIRKYGNVEIDRVATILTEPGAEFALIRSRIGNLLAFGQRHRALDADLLARVRTRDWISFTAAYNELWFGRRLERMGLDITFRPPNAKGGVAEFKARNGKQDAVVEVKTLFPASSASSGDRIVHGLRAVVEESTRPFMIRFTSWPSTGEFRRREFSAWLERELARLDSAALDGLEHSLTFGGRDGFRCELTAIRYSTFGGAACVWGRTLVSAGNAARVRDVLDSAYSQRSEAGTPYVVAVIDCMDFALDHYEMCNALTGDLYSIIDFDTNTQKAYRDTNGFFSPRGHRRVSAVVVARHHLGWTDRWDDELRVYHNPFAEIRLSRLFRPPARQFEARSGAEFVPVGT